MDETTIRRIIREEIARAFKITALEASAANSGEPGELETAALSEIESVSRTVTDAVVADTWHSHWCHVAYGGACTRDCETNWETS